MCRDARRSVQLWVQSPQGRPLPISARGAESTGTPVSPTPHFSAGRPRDAGSTRHPNPPFQRGAPPRPRWAGTPPLHLSAGQSPQGRPPRLISAWGVSPAQISRDPRPSTSARGSLGSQGPQDAPPFQLGELPAQVRRDVPGCRPSHQVCADGGAPPALRLESRRSWHKGIYRSPVAAQERCKRGPV